jgi:hypothetical protein
MASNFKKDKKNCLQIEWRAVNYYISIFSQDFFSNEAVCEEREHGVFLNNDEACSQVSCIVIIRADFALLMYRNQPEDIEEGDTLIHFSSAERDEVDRIDWITLNGKIQKDKAIHNWGECYE